METPSRGGWITLLIAGILNTLYGVAYELWSLFGLITGGGLAAVSTIGQISEGVENAGALVMAILGVLMPIINVCVFLVVPVMGLVTIFSAVRFKAFRSKGLVWLGILSAVGAPALGLVTSLTSCLNCSGGMCGFLMGNIGTIPMLVISSGLAGYSAFVLTRPEIAEAFEANA